MKLRLAVRVTPPLEVAGFHAAGRRGAQSRMEGLRPPPGEAAGGSGLGLGVGCALA